MIAQSGFFERFDSSQSERSLLGWYKDIAYAFSLHGLDIAVHDKGADGAADGIAGTSVIED